MNCGSCGATMMPLFTRNEKGYLTSSYTCACNVTKPKTDWQAKKDEDKSDDDLAWETFKGFLGGDPDWFE